MQPAALLGLTVGIGVVLLWASVSKLRDPRRFVLGVRQYQLVPPSLATPTAVLLIAAEGVTGALLVTQASPTLASSIAAVIFAVFACATWLALLRDRDVPCYCFGVEHDERITIATVIRAVILFALSSTAAVISAYDSVQAVEPAEVPLALTFAVGVVIVTLLADSVRLAVDAFRTRPTISPTQSPRISFRNEPFDFSFKQAVAQRYGLASTPTGPIGGSDG